MYLPIDARGSGKKTKKISNILFLILAVIAIFVYAFETTYSVIYVVGSSMESTLQGATDGNSAGGDYLYIFDGAPKRGDIVVIKTESRNIIKRVIALGGDTVELKRGVLYLNDEVVEEPYVDPENNTPTLGYNTYRKTTIEEGYIFVLGDNRNSSTDSRSNKYGCIPEENVLGVVAGWSLQYKGVVTAVNTFLHFNLGL